MEKKSCHQKCLYSKYCYYEGEDRDDYPDECIRYYNIEDMILEARHSYRRNEGELDD